MLGPQMCTMIGRKGQWEFVVSGYLTALICFSTAAAWVECGRRRQRLQRGRLGLIEFSD